MSTVSDSSVKPTVIVGADSRFATTFLSTKYRDKAVNGEALMDKTTGELFIKRPSDGKIVSFYQNKKMINDLAMDLRLLLINNTSFTYPIDNNQAFYISTNYDLITINNEVLYNLMVDDIAIPGAPNDINKLSFTVSGQSNGFFCRSATRDIDKSFIEFITNQYNSIVKEFANILDDLPDDYVAEYNKFQSNPKWENSNATIKYDIAVIKDGESYLYSDIEDYIILNEDNVIFFPEQIYTDLSEFDSVEVTIKAIIFDKLHFMVNNKDAFGTLFVESYDKFIAHDGRIEVADFNISHFVNNATSIDLFGNETIIAFLDVPHITKYMEKMKALFGNSRIEISKTQPNSACIWFKPND